jgi:SAM-dependent methyltransferase
MQHKELRMRLAVVFHNQPTLRTLFYVLTDGLVVTFWHMRRSIHAFAWRRKGTVHVLDAGTGMGQYVHYLSLRHPNWNIYAVDSNPEEIWACNEYFHRKHFERVLFRTENVVEMQRKEVYDLILAVNVIEYIKSDVQAVSNLYNALKPGGQLILSVRSDKNFPLQPNLSNKLTTNQELVHRYNNFDLKKLLRDGGFKQYKARYSYGISGRISTFLGISVPNRLLRRHENYLYIFPVYFLFLYPIIIILNAIDAYIGHSEGAEVVAVATKNMEAT